MKKNGTIIINADKIENEYLINSILLLNLIIILNNKKYNFK